MLWSSINERLLARRYYDKRLNDRLFVCGAKGTEIRFRPERLNTFLVIVISRHYLYCGFWPVYWPLPVHLWIYSTLAERRGREGRGRREGMGKGIEGGPLLWRSLRQRHCWGGDYFRPKCFAASVNMSSGQFSQIWSHPMWSDAVISLTASNRVIYSTVNGEQIFVFLFNSIWKFFWV